MSIRDTLRGFLSGLTPDAPSDGADESLDAAPAATPPGGDAAAEAETTAQGGEEAAESGEEASKKAGEQAAKAAAAKQENAELAARVNQLERQQRDAVEAAPTRPSASQTRQLENREVHTLDGFNCGRFQGIVANNQGFGILTTHPQYGDLEVGFQQYQSQLFVNLNTAPMRDFVVTPFIVNSTPRGPAFKPVPIDNLSDLTELQEEYDRLQDKYRSKASALEDLERDYQQAQRLISDLQERVSELLIELEASPDEVEKDLQLMRMSNRNQQLKEHSQMQSNETRDTSQHMVDKTGESEDARRKQTAPDPPAHELDSMVGSSGGGVEADGGRESPREEGGE